MEKRKELQKASKKLKRNIREAKKKMKKIKAEQFFDVHAARKRIQKEMKPISKDEEAKYKQKETLRRKYSKLPYEAKKKMSFEKWFKKKKSKSLNEFFEEEYANDPVGAPSDDISDDNGVTSILEESMNQDGFDEAR